MPEVGIPGVTAKLLDGGRIAVITMRGPVHWTYVHEFNNLLYHGLGTDVMGLVADYSSAKQISGKEIGILVHHTRRLRAIGGEVALVGPSDSVMRVIAPLGLDKMIMFFDTPEDAVQYIRISLGAVPPSRS